VLEELIPGSEDYYYYHALQYQNTGQKEKLAAVMAQWAKRFPHSPRRRTIENRGALLAYDTDPRATLAYLRDRLHLRLDAQQEARDRKPNLPSSLDQARIARGVFENEALRTEDDLGGCDEAALETLVSEKARLRPGQVRALLKRLRRPDAPNLVDLVAEDLKSRESSGFGEFDIHRALLPEQLDELARRIPSLAEEQAYVYTRLHKLAPGEDADAEFDPAERQAWLDRSWAYVRTLAPAFNSLKANILYQRLQFDRSRGLYDAARFLEYLKLPRRARYMNPRYVQDERAADLESDFTEAMATAEAIHNDEELVRDYFLHLLPANPDLDRWTPYVRESWLKPVLAEAMLTSGANDKERWASLLNPAQIQALRDRVDVDFAAANTQFHAPEDDVNLDLVVKNAPKLIIKVYEVNTLSWFLTHPRQLNTDLQLDGLVANRQTTEDTSAADPFVRTRRTFHFPELKGKRGAWIIEFIGGGKSSRALIRKGQFTLVQRAGPAGDMLTVLDENREPVKDAAAWLDGRKFTPDPKDGFILIPFTKEPGQKKIVLSDDSGAFASLATFQHHAEEYRLDAQFHIEREQLLAGKKATLAVRAALLMGDAQVPPDLLEDAKLSITSTTLDGVSTTAEVVAPKFEPGKVFTHEIQTPERLASLGVTLTAQVENLSQGGQKQTLSASRSWALNGIDKTESVSDGHLSQFGGDYVFELLGKNGEPLPDKAVAFHFNHQNFTRPVTLSLRTDEKGRILLGALDGIGKVSADIPNGRADEWPLRDCARTWPETLDAQAGAEIEAPWDCQGAVSLLETRGGTFVADRSANAAADPDASVVRIKGLAPGDYSLRLRGRETRDIALRVTAGKPVANWIVSPNRALEVRDPAPLRIEKAGMENGVLVIRLANAGPFTRVHVAATRFLPGDTLFALGGFERFEPGFAAPDKLPNLFAAGREIGDEYRYILERRSAKTYPGNMLARPGLLLDPWEVRSTDVNAQSTKNGDASGQTPGARLGYAGGGGVGATENQAAKPSPTSEGTDIDFLAKAAPVFYNLEPDENGLVRLDGKALGDRQHIQVYAENLADAAWRAFALPEKGAEFRDLRLAHNLDPHGSFTEKKEATALDAGQVLTLDAVATSKLETYDSLASVYRLFATLTPDSNLASFNWILQWPRLKDEEKRAKYSKFACHELNFFLSKKDPAFFEKVIKPFLSNKKDKTFMDDFLLGNDLARYLQPWAYSRLNIAERCLLARRLPEETAATARHLRDLWELLPPNPEHESLLFDTALLGRALESSDNGIVNEVERLETGEEFRNAVGGNLARLADTQEPANMPPNAPSTTSTIYAGTDKAGRRLPTDLNKALAWDAKRATDMRQAVRPYFRALGPTKEWAENNYYDLPLGRQTADLVPINAFWRDYAAWDGKAPFLSTHFAEASRDFPEMMLALAALDLPFDPPKHETKTDNGRFTLKAGGPLIAFRKEIKSAAPAKDDSGLLVRQDFFRDNDRFRQEDGEQVYKYVTGEFLAGEVYGASVAVTNPTSEPRKLEVLLQIPQGALPARGSKPTDSITLRLDPYQTKPFQYFFYFPQPAAQPFPQYPASVAREEKAAGAAKPFAFHVVRQLSALDKTSWDYVSQYGSEEDVFAFLEQNNIERMNLARVAWRARESAGFFRRIIALLARRHVYDDTLYSYALLHNDTAALREWLRHSDGFLADCGPWLSSALLTIDPIERRAYEHMEYSPLVNQRAHRIGAENHIANPVLRAQYQSLLGILGCKASLDAMDEMSVVYYLFLQNRVEEALARFHAIKPESLPTRIQYDYFRCYAAFYEEQPAEARAVAGRYADYPVDRWRQLFADVRSQLDETEGKSPGAPGDKPDREAQQGELAATEPAFDFKVENRQIALTWKNLPQVTINYYLMDPEFLFSSSPFVGEDPARFSIIKASKTVVEKLPDGKDALDIPLPAEYAKANVLVEILGAGQRKAQAYHANTLKLAVAENYGRLELRDQAGDKPLSKAYIKVYARLKGGAIRFFKDGYTDLRGKFDYASLNSSENAIPLPGESEDDNAGETMSYKMLKPDELGLVEKLAILVLSDSDGALVREVNPPGQ